MLVAINFKLFLAFAAIKRVKSRGFVLLLVNQAFKLQMRLRHILLSETAGNSYKRM